jgi:hypothetical protein
MFSLLMCLPAHAYEIESGSVIACDTQEQVGRFVQLFDGDQQLERFTLDLNRGGFTKRRA